MKILLENKQYQRLLVEMAYPPTFNMHEFKQIPVFSKRVKYCDERLKKLGSGSSRIAYLIDGDKVLKLAKNKKGIDQNAVESDQYLQRSYSDIVANVFDYDDNDYFVEMELVKKCKPSDFKRILGFEFELFQKHLINRHDYSKWVRKYELTDEEKDILMDNEWIEEVDDLIGTMDMCYFDLSRLSSMGIVVRDGEEKVVFSDYGLTQCVYKTHYQRK